MKKITLLIGILFLTGTYVVRADEVRIASSLDKSQVQIDEEVSLTIRILGARGNVQAPRLPALQGFDSFYTGRTSHFTFVDGKSSATIEFSYVLVPKVAGRFTLRSVEVWIEGKRFETQPLEVEVIGPQVQPRGAVPNPPAAPRAQTPYPGAPSQAPAPFPSAQPAPGPPLQMNQDDNIFVQATADKLTVYPNEQILLTYTLFTRYDTRYEGFEEEPSVSGFWIEDFPLDRDLGRDTVTIHGKRYVKADIRKIALFPTAPAQYKIQPGILKVSVREEPKTSSVFDEFFGDSFFSGASFFARRVDRLLKPEPITVTVRSFPESGKPSSFNGAVGQFRMSASADKSQVKQNEPVTLRLALEGEGNIETLPRPPVPELTGFKIYDGDTSSQLFKSGTTLGGRRTLEIIFIPTEAGELAIPPLEFSFFNPRTQNYEVLHTPSFPLRVMPSSEPFRLPAELAEKEAYQKEVRLEAKDIRYLHEELPSEGLLRFRRTLFRFLGGANLLGLMWVGNGLLRRRREAIFARDHGLKRRTLARSLALKRMKTLKRLAQSKKQEEAGRFVEEAERVLNEYLSNKFNVSAYSFTREWLEEKLADSWGPEDPLLKQIKIFYDLARETRFGRGVLAAEERQHFVELIELVMRRVEKMPSRRLAKFLWIPFLLFVYGWPKPVSAEVPQNPFHGFQEANTAYRAGEYERAAALYESLVKQGFKHANVFYNLGNAYFKQKRLGPAILYYEKAKRLSPRDRDVRANLKYVTGFLEYRIEDKRNWYLKMGEAFLEGLTREEIGILSLAFGVFFWLSWAFSLSFRPDTPWGWKRKTWLVLTLVCAGVWGLKEMHDMTVRDVIVLKPQAAVRYGPSYKDQVAFRLAEGMRVRIKKDAEEWSRVGLANGETGWMNKEEMGEI